VGIESQYHRYRSKVGVDANMYVATVHNVIGALEICRYELLYRSTAVSCEY